MFNGLCTLSKKWTRKKRKQKQRWERKKASTQQENRTLDHMVLDKSRNVKRTMGWRRVQYTHTYTRIHVTMTIQWWLLTCKQSKQKEHFSLQKNELWYCIQGSRHSKIQLLYPPCHPSLCGATCMVCVCGIQHAIAKILMKYSLSSLFFSSFPISRLKRATFKSVLIFNSPKSMNCLMDSGDGLNCE